MPGGVDPRFEAELRRGAVQLVALHYLETRRYGYDLVRLLGAAGFRVEEGTLYPILRRFEKQGVLTAEWDTSGSRPRKYYLLSEAGRALKTDMLAAWQAAREAKEAALSGPEPTTEETAPTGSSGTGTGGRTLTDGLGPREDYLHRLEEVLPTQELSRVREDVDALIHDHVAGALDADPALSQDEAEARAIAAMGSPERLAEELGVSSSVSIPLSVRRAFVRALAVLFGGHLLLSIVLTVAGSESAAIPGLLMPLPKGPFLAVLLSVLTIFLIDAGAVLMLFATLGTRSSMPSFPHLRMRDRWNRRDAWQGLCLVALLTVVFNVLLDPIFSVKEGQNWTPFLSPDLKALVPYVNVALALLAARHVLTLLGKGESAAAIGADALAALAGSVLLAIAAAQGELVNMPAGALGEDAAHVLDSLIERVFLLVFIVAALLLLGRFVRQSLRFVRVIRS